MAAEETPSPVAAGAIVSTLQTEIWKLLKANGVWAVMFAALAMYVKPTLDKFVDSHFELVGVLKEDQISSKKLMQESVDRNEKMWMSAIEANRELVREISRSAAEAPRTPEVPQYRPE